MDLRLAPDEERFRARLLAWLDEVEPPEGLRDYGATPTGDDIGSARAWQRQLFDAGWAGLSWPVEHGGRGASPMELAVFAEEMARAGLPRQLNLVSLELAGPMIIAYGTPEQRERFLPPVLRGEEAWCQLFSEPEAGSDLAGLRAQARPTAPGRWAVTGQKVWTSGAHYAELGLLLARTGPDAPAHKGISCFLLPMDRPGIEVRPLRQMDGESKFNEVFLDGVEVSEADLLGAAGDGWAVAMSTLGRERLTLGAQAVGFLDALEELAELARARGVVDDPRFRQRYAAVWSRARLLRLTWLRAVAGDGRGAQGRASREMASREMASREMASREMSVLKLASSELQRELADLGAPVLGPDLVAGPAGERWAHRLLAAPGQRIAGGTSEIQRNIIGERALGLPREPR